MSHNINSPHLKIFFFGAPYFSKEILAELLNNNILINTVITHPDKPISRKQVLESTELKKLALQKNIPIEEFSKLDSQALKFFKEDFKLR